MARTNSITKEKQNYLISIKGSKCCNCETECGNNIIFHHVIPISIGGTENDSNLVPLCKNCHTKLHGISSENNILSHSALIKEGIKKAKENGIHCGRKEITKDDIPSIFYEFYEKTLNNELTITEAAARIPMSRTTFYKYKKILEENN